MLDTCMKYIQDLPETSTVSDLLETARDLLETNQ